MDILEVQSCQLSSFANNNNSSDDDLVKHLQVRHSRKRGSPVPLGGMIFLDSRFRGNDKNRCILTFHEFIK